MRGRTVLVLLTLVVAMVAFIVFIERDLPSTDEREEQGQRLLGIEADEVVEVSIESPAGAVRLRRKTSPTAGDDIAAETSIAAAEWRLLEPMAARADGAAVDRLLASLARLDKERILDDVDAAGVGLAPPAATVVLQLEDGERRLDLGARVPGSASAVAAIAGDPRVYVIAASIFGDIEREPGQWRSRELFLGERSKIERVVIHSGGEALELERRGGEFWLASPIADRADQETVDALLSGLVGLQIASFVDEPAIASPGPDERSVPEGAESTGLEAPAWLLEAFETGNDEPFRLAVGAPIGDSESRRYGRVGDQVFEADSELFAMLERPSTDWLSRRLTTLRVFEIDRLSVSGDDLSLDLERAGSDWLREGDRIAADRVADLLYAITGATATEVITGEVAASWLAGLDHGGWNLNLASDGGAEEVFTVFPAADGLHPVRSSSRESLLLLDPRAIEELRVEIAKVFGLPSIDPI